MLHWAPITTGGVIPVTVRCIVTNVDAIGFYTAALGFEVDAHPALRRAVRGIKRRRNQVDFGRWDGAGRHLEACQWWRRGGVRTGAFAPSHKAQGEQARPAVAGGNAQVGDHRGKNLQANGVFGTAEKASDFEMLFDPSKQQLDLPAFAVERSDLGGRSPDVVTQDGEQTADPR